MKKKWVLTVTMAWLLMLMMTVQSWAIDVIYANVDKMKIFEEKDTNSRVLKTVSGGTSLLYATDEGSWYGVLLEDPNGGQMVGWVREKDMTLSMPSRYCNHNWSSWETYQEPTCTQEGMQTRGCSICGVGETRAIEKLGHNYGGWQVTRQPSCTQEGERVAVCSRCGKQQSETIEKEPHRFNEWTVTREPTCTQEGERVHTCIVCGYQERQVMDRLPHAYGDWKVLTEPTCTREGERVHYCAVCGYQEYEVLSMLPHAYEWKITLEYTDHSAGEREQICKDCGQIGEHESFDPPGTLRRGDNGEEVREIQELLADQDYVTAYGADGKFGAATEQALMDFQEDQGLTPDGIAWPQTIKRLQHTFGPWQMEDPLTREEPGTVVRTCTECGYKQQETLELVPYFERGSRGEDVRTAQQMLTELTFDAGKADGIYGPKFDAAFKALAEEEDLEFEEGKVLPWQFDALAKCYLKKVSVKTPDDRNAQNAPVKLALRVAARQEMDELIEDDEEETEQQDAAWEDPEGLVTYTWILTNEGEEEAVFRTLLMQFGSDPDFRTDPYVMVLDGETLLANGANSISGTFRVSKDWGKGDVNFSALAVSGEDETQSVWMSNIETCEAFYPEEAAEPATEAVTETGEPEEMAETEAETETMTEAEEAAEPEAPETEELTEAA